MARLKCSMRTAVFLTSDEYTSEPTMGQKGTFLPSSCEMPSASAVFPVPGAPAGIDLTIGMSAAGEYHQLNSCEMPRASAVFPVPGAPAGTNLTVGMSAAGKNPRVLQDTESKRYLPVPRALQAYFNISSFVNSAKNPHASHQPSSNDMPSVSAVSSVPGGPCRHWVVFM